MSTPDDPLAGRASVLTQALLLSVLVAVAAYLRLRYAQDIHLYVDEFGTLLAVRSILERGLPILPSGTFYSHGLLFSYLDALFVSLLRFGETVARLPSVFIGALTVPLVYLAGKRLFSSGVGWIAAGALAVDPQAIVWGGRARMYSLLQALILLATVFLVLGAIVGDRVRYRVLGAICIVAAIFTHPEAALFVLPVVMAVLLLRGPRWILRADVILEAILISLALVGVYLMNKWGQAGLLETMGAERPFVALTSTELRGLQTFGPFLADLYRLPWSLFSLAGLGILLWGTFRRRSLAGMGDADRSLLTLYILFGVVMVILVFLVGDTWQEPRYAFMMLPLLSSLCLYDAAPSVPYGGRVPGKGRPGAWLARPSRSAGSSLGFRRPVHAGPHAVHLPDGDGEGFRAGIGLRSGFQTRPGPLARGGCHRDHLPCRQHALP